MGKMDLNEKTNVLIEALPYIKRFKGKIMVVKLGGDAMSKMEHLIQDIVLLNHIGIKPVIIHGGGPEINTELNKVKITPKFVNGLRYTDDQIIKIVENVFDKINNEILANIKHHGAKSVNAEGCIKVKQKSPELAWLPHTQMCLYPQRSRDPKPALSRDARSHSISKNQHLEFGF